MISPITSSAVRAFAEEVGQSSHATCFDVLLEAAEAMDAMALRIVELEAHAAKAWKLDAAEKVIAAQRALIAELDATSDECNRQDAAAELRGRIAGLRWVLEHRCVREWPGAYYEDADEIRADIVLEIERLEAEAKR